MPADKRISFIDQELARLTENITMEDWNVIRTEEHWSIRDKMENIKDKNKFLLGEVKKYVGEDESYDPFDILD